MSRYETVIGLEVHVQLATASKIFSRASHAFGRPANSQVDAVALGLPGSLPVLNAEAVRLAVIAGLALHCDIQLFSKFDRKHYFYPDLPKGYQISQYDQPYALGGGVDIDLNGHQRRRVALTRIHMEEDAGKLVHQGSWSAVDLNRAGTPLCEIVSEPDLRSPAEAYAFLVELRRAMKYCGVSDCEMQQGSLRCDANISIRPAGDSSLGTKVEVKNLNSFRAVEAAIQFESDQQIALHRAGRYNEVVQETKLWDPDRNCTQSMRGKEGAADYRYFPDPDLPPLTLSQEQVDTIAAELPELPRQREDRFVHELGLKPVTAAELTAEKDVADYFEALIAAGCSVKSAANWTREEGLRLAADKKLPVAEAAPIAHMAALISLVENNLVARVIAKEHADELFSAEHAAVTPHDFFAARGMIQEQNEDQLQAWIDEVLAANAQVVEQIQAGKVAAVGRLVGNTMKLSGGKADPKAVKSTILSRLGVDG